MPLVLFLLMALTTAAPITEDRPARNDESNDRLVISTLGDASNFADKPQDEPAAEHKDETEREDGVVALMQGEALDKDARLVAKQFGWGYRETLQHLQAQELFGHLVAELEELVIPPINLQYDEQLPVTPRPIFAASAFSRKPGSPARIWLVDNNDDNKNYDEVSRQAQSLMDGFSERTNIPVLHSRNSRFSMQEQEERMDKIESALIKEGMKSVSAAVRPGDVILVTVADDDQRQYQTDLPEAAMADSGDFDTLAEIARQQQGKTDEGLAAIMGDVDMYGVFFAFVKEEEGEPIEANEHVRGGRQVRSDTKQCTSGFSVERLSDGVTGVATAAHCYNMHTFDAEHPEADFALYHRAEHDGTWGDMEWKTSSHIELAEYWANVGDKRQVTARKTSFSNNDVVCVYSRMQGKRDCDYVYSTSTSQQGSKKLIAMDGYHTTGGDSGGPWSYGSTAAGIHKGYKTIWFKKRNTFSRISYLDEALGVRVLLQ